MRLQRPFCRLPIRFDADRLRYEIEALPASAWAPHPSGYNGNSALRLITARGEENDDVAGEMRPTSHFLRCPYLQQVLASFGVVWSRARLMKLSARAAVPQHCDVSYHWHHRVRVHIPIATNPEVRFFCGEDAVHMGAGEAWIFDNWRPHRVENHSHLERIHLVADTMGNQRFWDMARQGQWENFSNQTQERPLIPYRAVVDVPVLTERFNSSVVMPPAELEALIATLSADLATRDKTTTSQKALFEFRHALRGFCSEWRQLWSLFADEMPGWPYYASLRQQLRDRLAEIEEPVYIWSNQILAAKALHAGVLEHVLNPPGMAKTGENEYGASPEGAATARTRAPKVQLDRPIFIVSAPRSGSTLLFETLAQSLQIFTLGGEAHALVEQFSSLRPGPTGSDSNRLTERNLTPEIARGIIERIGARARDASGRGPSDGDSIRLLEKTPKNSLRIPFFRALFPDAIFLFLWRSPEENVSSIMEAWRAGGWVTYPELDGFDRPWSMLLPPGWQAMRGKPLEEIAAFQWQSTNEIILDDLGQVPRESWISVCYEDLLSDPRSVIQELCTVADLPFCEGLQQRLSGPLPASRHTLTRPEPGKWRKNETDLRKVIPGLEATLARLEGLENRVRNRGHRLDGDAEPATAA